MSPEGAGTLPGSAGMLPEGPDMWPEAPGTLPEGSARRPDPPETSPPPLVKWRSSRESPRFRRVSIHALKRGYGENVPFHRSRDTLL